MRVKIIFIETVVETAQREDNAFTECAAVFAGSSQSSQRVVIML